MSSTVKRSLSGIQPSGDVHIGNYLGMIKPAVEKQDDYQCIYFIVDFHALTSLHDAARLKCWTLDLVATWLACGLDVNRHILFRQSDVACVTELAWYLSCVTGVGFLERSHAYKDKVTKNIEPNHGLFAYPVLMAADILLYDVDIVPVGKDQKQHVEMARDMAGYFNTTFGNGQEVLKLPKHVIQEDVMTIPGLDGRKMSKSYNNGIDLFATDKDTRKKIMGIATDSTPVEAPKVLRGTVLGQFFELFATPSQYADIEQRLAKGGLGWGHAKDELATLINSELSETRKLYQDIRPDEEKLKKVLAEGAEKARGIAFPVLDRVREAVGTGKIS